MKKLTIIVSDSMWQHTVNGFAKSADAHERLDAQEQQELVGGKVFDYCASVAKANAVIKGSEQAAIYFAAQADAIIVDAKATAQITVEEVPE